MQIERRSSDTLTVNRLPDGARVIVDSANETVFALNPTAGAAWDACASPTTLAGVTERMRQEFNSATTEDVAEEAILRLAEKNLVSTSQGTTRRQVLGSLGVSVALPLVASLTFAEQQALAMTASSLNRPRPTPTTPLNP
jgi:hypothetical protein